jgi:hypothetical protein
LIEATLRSNSLSAVTQHRASASVMRALHRTKATRERDVLVIGRRIEHRKDRGLDRIDDGIGVLGPGEGVPSLMW